jgi:hypothetical protein
MCSADRAVRQGEDEDGSGATLMVVSIRPESSTQPDGARDCCERSDAYNLLSFRARRAANKESEGLGFAGVAQLVEQLTCNQQVKGSSPLAS